MKLLVTDYDKTLKTSVKNLYINLSTINKFRNNGNKFAIATGRCFESIKKEISKFNIKYDYLICNNGLIIFDKGGNIVKCSLLSNEDLINIYSLINMNNEVNFFKLYNLYTSTKNLKDILEVYVSFKNSRCAKEYKSYIEEIMPNIFCYREGRSLFIGNKSSKATGISFIQEIENIDKKDIYTVGDNSNDISMLEDFNGYKMLVSHPSLYLKRFPITKEVHTLIKKINK